MIDQQCCRDCGIDLTGTGTRGNNRRSIDCPGSKNDILNAGLGWFFQSRFDRRNLGGDANHGHAAACTLLSWRRQECNKERQRERHKDHHASLDTWVAHGCELLIFGWLRGYSFLRDYTMVDTLYHAGIICIYGAQYQKYRGRKAGCRNCEGDRRNENGSYSQSLT